MEVELIPEEFSTSERYLARCFYWIYLKVLPKSKWKIVNSIKLSIFPGIVFINGIFILNELFKILSANILENQMQFSNLLYLYFTIVGANFVLGANTFITNFTSPLMYTIPYLSEESFFYHPVNVIFQWVAFAILCIVIFGLDYIVMIFVGSLEAELSSIVTIISQVNDENVTRKDSKKIFQQIYLSHVKILKVINQLQTILWHLSLHILLSNFIFICMSIYIIRFISISFPIIITFSNGLFQLFILCYLSQVILDKTEEFADALYQIAWYDLPIEDQKTLLIILCMAQQLKGINASGLTTISINTLLQVVKTALSYGAFLYTLIN
ncbi:odorant receptor 22b-like [Phlebotomus argentipes]|uniref:odorant receptor 22b-like n=1 Tax=Phlebotomus argentipes TaxID=94469 RepID=UPI002892B9A6|nr:odorant receptor 22b-like [Phlebotomus argentipes]